MKKSKFWGLVNLAFLDDQIEVKVPKPRAVKKCEVKMARESTVRWPRKAGLGQPFPEAAIPRGRHFVNRNFGNEVKIGGVVCWEEDPRSQRRSSNSEKEEEISD